MSTNWGHSLRTGGRESAKRHLFSQAAKYLSSEKEYSHLSKEIESHDVPLYVESANVR